MGIHSAEGEQQGHALRAVLRYLLDASNRLYFLLDSLWLAGISERRDDELHRTDTTCARSELVKLFCINAFPSGETLFTFLTEEMSQVVCSADSFDVNVLLTHMPHFRKPWHDVRPHPKGLTEYLTNLKAYSDVIRDI